MGESRIPLNTHAKRVYDVSKAKVHLFAPKLIRSQACDEIWKSTNNGELGIHVYAQAFQEKWELSKELEVAQVSLSTHRLASLHPFGRFVTRNPRIRVFRHCNSKG